MRRNIVPVVGLFAILCVFGAVIATGHTDTEGPVLLGIRAEFFLFALTLVGVALLHHRTLEVALVGLAAILLCKFLFVPGFHLVEHLHREWQILLNLLGLLLGFALLARHFEDSRLPEWLPTVLPSGWKGGFVLLAAVFVLSSFLDNIAAAMIGGAMAMVVFRGRVDTGFLAAIVAASNGGGSGSVVGDTTTTMMWIDGVAAIDVTHAYAAAIPALFISGIIASVQQQRFQPLEKGAEGAIRIDWVRIFIVALVLAGAIVANFALDFPAVGVWAAILIGALFTKTAWGEVSNSIKGSVFLLSLVLSASMMPVEQLPVASWKTAFGLGFVSAVFDNIPLTKLALVQGGYDWGMLAYTVGYGGSMIWFGSSAGVALSNMFPQAKSVGTYLQRGWHVTVAYVLGFAILMTVLGWRPHPPHRGGRVVPVQEVHEAGRH